MGQDPSLAYVKQTRNMWFKARKDKIPIQKWEACWIEGRSISFGNVSREAEQYLLERWVWRKLCKFLFLFLLYQPKSRTPFQ
jgi:hypothetical protein